MPRESLHVAVVLSGVVLKRFARKFAGLPILIKRMLKKILFRDGSVDFFQKLCVGHARDPPN